MMNNCSENDCDRYIINKEDFERFAQQMIVTFPFMPEMVRKEWSDRINRVRSNHLETALQAETDRVVKKLTDETKIHNLHIENGEFELQTEGVIGHQLIRFITDFYESNGGENYFTMEFHGKVRDKPKHYELTIRNLDGNKSPATTINELKNELKLQHIETLDKILNWIDNADNHTKDPGNGKTYVSLPDLVIFMETLRGEP